MMNKSIENTLGQFFFQCLKFKLLIKCIENLDNVNYFVIDTNTIFKFRKIY